MENILHVEGNPSLVRDVVSNAIVNTNESEYQTYLKNKNIIMDRVNQILE